MFLLSFSNKPLLFRLAYIAIVDNDGLCTFLEFLTKLVENLVLYFESFNFILLRILQNQVDLFLIIASILLLQPNFFFFASLLSLANKFFNLFLERHYYSIVSCQLF